MRLIFAGTPNFAAVSLLALMRRNHEIVLVLTQPDKISGRGLKVTTSAVKEVALENHLALQQPASLKDPGSAERLAECQADACIVVAYGLILPQDILELPHFGCLNVHASLLPRWRGAAPIQRAIMAGDSETGVCVMQMDAGLDTGPVYLCERTVIGPHETAGTLHDRLAELGARAVCEVLDRLASQPLVIPVAQRAEGVTYANKIGRVDACIDWNRPAAEVERLLRALDPVPGAYSEYERVPLKLWRGKVRRESGAQAPGEIVSTSPDGVVVRCADADLCVTELQRPGGRRMRAEQFLHGFPLRPGGRFGAALL